MLHLDRFASGQEVCVYVCANYEPRHLSEKGKSDGSGRPFFCFVSLVDKITFPSVS